MRTGRPEAAPSATTAPIRLRIQNVNQLFHTLDPFPFRERDLDEDVEDYVVGWAREAAYRGPLVISIDMPADQARGEDAAHIAHAFRHYFEGRAEVLGRDLRALFRTGRDALTIGLAVLGLTVALGAAVTRLVPEGFAQRFFAEGLIILGWVANWKPIDIFLFEWWPIARKRDLYRRLAQARVEVVETPPAALGE
jgi:hypothetical protein